MDGPHVLWVEVGFGVAVAVFTALAVVGRELGTAAFTVTMVVFLGAFIGLTIAAEAAAVRSEGRGVERGAASRARTATDDRRAARRT